MPKELLAPVFSSQLNSTFRGTANGTDAVEFELIEVNPRPSPNGYECFTLRFRAPLSTPPEQRTYRFEHEQVPPMEMFVVPLEKDERGVVFEAVFNRLLVPRD